MNLNYTPEYEKFREEVRAFLDAEWPPKDGDGVSPREKQKRFFLKATERAYLNRSIPKRYGGSEQEPDLIKAQIIREAFSEARAPMQPLGNGALVVPTLLAHGTEWQKEEFIPKTLTGEIVWAQGYSEPGAGSDLASVKTRGVLEGDEWVINGQKVWTSLAHLSNYMFALVRTEPEAPKHKGISYLLLDMKQPGVEVRPLRQITGGAEFNEVFFTDARTPRDWIVGERGEGWQVSRTTLTAERNVVGGANTTGTLFDKLVGLAKGVQRNGKPAIEDPEIRQWLAALECHVLAHKYASYRQLTRNARGQDAGIFQMMNKLFGTNVIGLEVARIAQELLTDDALILPPARDRGSKPEKGNRPLGNERWVNQILGSLGNVVAGGTSNIQRNIISERGFGLPREG